MKRKDTLARDLRTQSDFPRFSFGFMSLSVGAEEVGSWEMSIGADTKSPNKSLLSSQRTGKG